MLGHWSPTVKESIESWLSNFEKNGEASGSLVATFDFDQTCVKNDVGEAVFHRMVENMEFAFNTSFYDLIGADYEAASLRELVDALLAFSPNERKSSSQFLAYQKKLLHCYYDRLEKKGPLAAYPWLAQLMVGLSEEMVLESAAQAIKLELSIPMEVDATLKIDRGLRLFTEIKDLMMLLKKRGFDIWVVSASSYWSVKVAIELLQLPVDKVMAMSVKVENGLLTNCLEEPIPVGQGKLELIKKTGLQPKFAAGDSPSDFPMLGFASDLALFIDHGNEEYRKYAQEKGWLIQEAFIVMRHES